MYRKQLAAVRYINPYRFFGWFVGLAIPWALLNSAFIAWHNSAVGTPELKHLVLRGAVGLLGGIAILAIVASKAIWPALQRAEEAERQQKTGSG